MVKPTKKRDLNSDSDTSDSGPDDVAPAKKSKPASKPVSKEPASSASKQTSPDGGDDPAWHLGQNKWVKVREFKGKTYVDIREYYVDKATMDTRPGKKGISLNCEQYQKLKGIIDDIDHALP